MENQNKRINLKMFLKSFLVLIALFSIWWYAVNVAIGVSTKFSNNDRVIVIDWPDDKPGLWVLIVRQNPWKNETVITKEPTWTIGTVLGTSVFIDGYNWWNIKFDNGYQGWSAENYLEKYILIQPTELISLYNTPTNSIINTWAWRGGLQNIDGFRLYRKVNSGTYSIISTLPPFNFINIYRSYQDNAVTPGVTYCYKVSVYKGTLESAFSNEQCDTVPLVDTCPNITGVQTSIPAGYNLVWWQCIPIIITPPVPNNIPSPPINASAITISSSQINFKWYDNSDNETWFWTYRSVNNGAYSLLLNSESFSVSIKSGMYHEDKSLSPNTKYCYKVLSSNTYWNSDFSNETCATTLTDSIPNVYACSDGNDNDGDWKVDYPADPWCTSANDTDEYNPIITSIASPTNLFSVYNPQSKSFINTWSWNDSLSIDWYKIYKKTGASEYSLKTTIPFALGKVYQDFVLTGWQTHCYQVSAYKDTIESALSNEYCDTTLTTSAKFSLNYDLYVANWPVSVHEIVNWTVIWTQGTWTIWTIIDWPINLGWKWWWKIIYSDWVIWWSMENYFELYYPPIDICPNIIGEQTSVPTGYNLVWWQCVPIISTKFSLNDRIQVINWPIKARVHAWTGDLTSPTQATWNLGKVIGGPTFLNDINWWNINYDTGSDGWSAEQYLEKYVPPVDVCPNKDGVQTSVPDGMKIVEGNCIPVTSTVNHTPTLTFPSVPYDDGIDPNTGTKDTTKFTFKVIYTDSDNDKPSDVTLYYRGANWGVWSTWALVEDTNWTGVLFNDKYDDWEMFTFSISSLEQANTYEYYFTTDDSQGGQFRIPASWIFNFVVKDVVQKKQCNDEVDNDGDGKKDKDDAGCHTDGNALNPNSYDESDNDENSKPKVIIYKNNPFIILAGNPINLLTDVVGVDEEDGTWITTNIQITIPDKFKKDSPDVGKYEIIYKVNDSNGLVSNEKKRNVIVIDSADSNKLYNNQPIFNVKYPPWYRTLVACTLHIDKTLPTIVLTHGLSSEGQEVDDLWTSCGKENKAGSILRNLWVKANIVSYVWEEANHVGKAPIASAYIAARIEAPDAGIRLSQELYKKLGYDYDKPIHFIGHSLGTVVNTYAAKNLLEKLDNVKYAQFTILDYPNNVEAIPEIIPDILPTDEDTYRVDEYWIKKDFFASLLPINKPGLTLKIDNYHSHNYVNSLGAGVGDYIDDFILDDGIEHVYNHETLVDPNDVGWKFFTDEKSALIINNDHSGVQQWYRWTMDPNHFQENEVKYCEGNKFNISFFSTLSKTLSPCEKWWKLWITNYENSQEWWQQWAKNFPPNTQGNSDLWKINFWYLRLEERKTLLNAWCTINPDSISCKEASSPFIIFDVDIPKDTTHLSFDYNFLSKWDWDYFSVLLDNNPIWILSWESSDEGKWSNTWPIPIDAFTWKHRLTIALFGVNDDNSEIEVKNFQMESIKVKDETPPTTILTTTWSGVLTWTWTTWTWTTWTWTTWTWTTWTWTTNWYRSDVSITLSAQDNPGWSWIDKIEYSLNNGIIWIPYLAPFTITGDGLHVVQYRSIDKAWNTEPTKTQTIKIDKTSPEAKVSPSIDKIGVEVTWIDNLSNVTVTKVNETNYTLTDEAGNTTKIVINIEKQKRNFKKLQPKVSYKIVSIQYNTAKLIKIANNDLTFEWYILNKKYNLLNQYIELYGKFEIEAEYKIKKNQTNILIRTTWKPKKETLNGLKITRFETKNGVLQYGY